MYSSSLMKGQLLIATPLLRKDALFRESVIVICDHSDMGSMGIVVNHKMNGFNLYDLLQELSIESYAAESTNIPIYTGGPVEKNRGFILHNGHVGDWRSSMAINDELIITTSIDILTSINANQGPDKYLVALGYSGWAAGQLEEEIKNNAWVIAPLDINLLFNTPLENMWHASGLQLGIDISHVSQQVGHA